MNFLGFVNNTGVIPTTKTMTCLYAGGDMGFFQSVKDAEWFDKENPKYVVAFYAIPDKFLEGV